MNEGNSGKTNVTCTVSLDKAPNTKDLKLTIKTSDGTAKTNDNDYNKLDDDFKFNKDTSELNKEFTIEINGDTSVESDETFTAKVQDNDTDNEQDFTLPSNQSITIVNDDSGGGGSISTCPGQIITNLNGATASATDSASGSISANATYYYQFTPAVTGTIQVNSSGSSSKNSLFIKNGCGSNLWSQTDNTDSKASTAISVAAGQQIVIAYENRKDSSKTYSLEFTFTAGGSGTTTLDVTKTVDSPSAKIGDQVTFTIVGKNNGSSSTQIEIIDTLPAGLTYVSANENKQNFSCSRSGQVITCNGSRNFSPNESVAITVTATVAASGTLTNTATIKGASGTSVIDTATASVTGDNGALSVSNASLSEGDSGSNPMTFTVSLDTLNPAQDVTVSYATSNGTATGGTSCTSGVDYVTKTGTVTIPHNTLSATFQVSVCGDTTDTVDETFNITLSNPVNASIDGATGIGTINDDDGVILGSNDMCYDTPTTSGVCTGLAGLNCTVTTTIRNKSGVALDNVQLIKAYNGISMGVISAIGIDATAKTTATDTDNAETNAALSSFGSNFGFSGTYNKGIVYRPDTSSPWGTSESHTVYDRTGFAFNLGTMEYVAQYTKGGKTYQSQLASCSINTSSPSTRDFTKTFSANINGNMQIIGNSVMLSGTQCAPATTNNNNLTLKFANKDTAVSTFTRFNSTSADLSLPDGIVADDIEWAGLYWQGRLSSSSSKKANGQSVLLKTPAMNDYVTIQTDPSKFNWTTSQFEYQGVADITDYVKSGMDGTYWVANVNAEEMSNGYGAWSLVIVYKEQAASLKNISVYDGFMGIYKGASGTNGIYNNKPVTLSGFLTPTSGDVNSKFLVFAGEGDISLADSVTMTDNTNTAQSFGSNVFNSSEQIEGVNVISRNPSCANTIGVDIDTFNVGSTSSTTPIIGNAQTETTVTLTSGGDEYFPGVFAFSTELYTPDVCYTENVLFNNLPVSSSNLPSSGDVVTYDVGITNKNNETAKGVFIEKVFDKPREITYVANSMSIAPIPGTTYSSKTDTLNDDTAEFASDTNTSKFFLGTGASAGMGGSIAKDVLTKFKYNTQIGDQNASENIYLVSYRNDQLGVDFTGIPIRKCQDFNNSFGIQVPIPGKFNTVMTGRVTDGSDNGSPYSENRLLTQITNKNFSLDVLSLADDLRTINTGFKGVVQVEFITPPYDTCADAPLLAGSPTLYAGFVGTSQGGGRAAVETDNGATSFAIPTASSNTAARVRYVVNSSNSTVQWNCTNNTDACIWGMLVSTFGNNANTPCSAECQPGGGSGANQKTPACVECVFGPSHTKTSCSKDVFAIRPDRINIDVNETRLIGGKLYQYNMDATQYGITTASAGYTQTIDNTSDKNGTMQLIVPTGCTLASSPIPLNQSITFNSGDGSLAWQYPNVGDVNITVADQNWVMADLNSSSPSDSDCVEGSTSNSIDENGKVGCLIKGIKQVTFFPKQLDAAMTIVNKASSGSYTYLSNERNMSVPMNVNITASIEGGGTATNYTANCFARDINTSISLVNDKPLLWNTAKTRINFYDDLNITSKQMSQIRPSAIFKSGEGNFTNGVAPIKWYFNFDRNQTIPEPSFNIARNDFNITSIIDQNSTSGNDFDRTNDMNVTFVYGRFIPRDVRVFGNSGFSANGWYEVFAAPAIGATALVPSRNESGWYINSLHNDATDGDASVSRVSPAPTGVALPLTSVSNATGIETYTFVGQTPPYSAKAHIDTDSWLWYGINASGYVDPDGTHMDCFTHPCFNINVVQPLGASGSAKSGAEQNKGSKSTVNSAKSGSTFKSTSEYAPSIR
ncbi:MAG: Calx-beta domain-containing protein [Sulfuricurvum sp.]|nr:Calx-beta domain-containing protein [Sulfuricurvum sp.]